MTKDFDQAEILRLTRNEAWNAALEAAAQVVERAANGDMGLKALAAPIRAMKKGEG